MKGSEWNKWDLHIHSPMTWLANVYADNCDIETYVRKLGEQQLSLIGLTNYFYFQENELEIIRSEIGRQGLNITVLGNVEFRLDQQNKDEAFINVHVLFSDKLSTSKINEILSRLPLKLTDDSGKKYTLVKAAYVIAGITWIPSWLTSVICSNIFRQR
jgi:hypothetical protein